MKEINISEIKGIKIGHAQDLDGGTGCSVIICENGGIAGVDVRGGGPASRETELLKPLCMVEKIHAVMLSGGSAFGLDACGGAMKYLEEKSIGFDVGVTVVPIVCGASLFDLVVGDPYCRPDKEMGYQACKDSENLPISEGNVGAGTGSSVGKFLGIDRMMKSGLGVYAVEKGGVMCGAVVAVNALGDIVDVDTGDRIAGILSEDKNSLSNTEEIMLSEIEKSRNVFSGNTTIACIITNGKLTKNQANKLASVAHNGFARAIRPVHTSADGDTIFVLSTGEVEVNPDTLGVMATDVIGRAINRAARKATSAYGLKSAKDFEWFKF